MGSGPCLDAARRPVVPRRGGRRTHRRASRRLILLGLLAACAPAPRWEGLAKIGLILPFHGPAPREAEATHVAVRDALIARNRAGGIRGRRLELVSLDSWSDPTTARLRAAELLADPLVIAALVGGEPQGASGGRVGEAPWGGAALSTLAAANLPTAPVTSPADALAALDDLLTHIRP